MKCNLHVPMGEVLRQWLVGHIKNCQPRLCSEFSDINNSNLFQLISRDLNAWDTDCFFLFVSENDKTKVKILNSNKLEETLGDYFESGVTVTIVDPTNGSGCTIDWEGYGEQDIGSEVLVIAWGEHESLAQQLADEFGAGKVFRGN